MEVPLLGTHTLYSGDREDAAWEEGGFDLTVLTHSPRQRMCVGHHSAQLHISKGQQAKLNR